jgi:hypothetical protein
MEMGPGGRDHLAEIARNLYIFNLFAAEEEVFSLQDTAIMKHIHFSSSFKRIVCGFRRDAVERSPEEREMGYI